MTSGEVFQSAWDSTAAAIGLADETRDRLGALLFGAHREPQRHYHGVSHVEDVLANLDALGARTPVTELAAFFHDAVYDPTAGDNEERSADLAQAWLAGLPEADPVATIVRATAGHRLPDNAPAGCAAFLDADLATLGAEPDAYDRYSAGIAAEYSHLDADMYRAGRARVLEMFLGTPRLFLTEQGVDLWEAPARANLTRELTTLR